MIQKNRKKISEWTLFARQFPRKYFRDDRRRQKLDKIERKERGD